MAGDWIKIERDLPHKPEVMRMAEILKIDELQIVGHLVLFWSWCDANMSLDCPDVIGTKRGLDRASCRDGMVDALLQVGWLEVVDSEKGETYRIPNFERHLSKSAKTRAIEQRKKQQQRIRSTKRRDTCPDANGTTSGPEKRREEKSSSFSLGDEIRIPDRLNTPAVLEMAQRWFRHLELKDKHEKIPPRNSPQEQAWWSQIAKLGAEKFLAQAEKAMSEGWVTLRDVPDVAGKAKLEQSSEWIKALNAARSYPSDYETRKRILGPELFEALKRTGTARVAAANDFELKTLAASFYQHLKDLRNGTPICN